MEILSWLLNRSCPVLYSFKHSLDLSDMHGQCPVWLAISIPLIIEHTCLSPQYRSMSCDISHVISIPLIMESTQMLSLQYRSMSCDISHAMIVTVYISLITQLTSLVIDSQQHLMLEYQSYEGKIWFPEHLSFLRRTKR